jgi:hypothetical protein
MRSVLLESEEEKWGQVLHPISDTSLAGDLACLVARLLRVESMVVADHDFHG